MFSAQTFPCVGFTAGKHLEMAVSSPANHHSSHAPWLALSVRASVAAAIAQVSNTDAFAPNLQPLLLSILGTFITPFLGEKASKWKYDTF